MSACWGCVNGVKPCSPSANQGVPQGVCWDCHILACDAHASKDLGSGKWLCHTDVASIAAYSSGLIGSDDTRTWEARFYRGSARFDSSQELGGRFPDLYAASAADRSRWSSGEGEEILGRVLVEKSDLDLFLAADSIGMAMFLIPDADRLAVGAVPQMSTLRFFAGEFGMFLQGLRDVG